MRNENTIIIKHGKIKQNKYNYKTWQWFFSFHLLFLLIVFTVHIWVDVFFCHLPFSDFGGTGSIFTAVVVAWREVDTSATWQGTEAKGSLLTKLFKLELSVTFIDETSCPFHDETTGKVLLHPASEWTIFVLPEKENHLYSFYNISFAQISIQ